MFCSIVEDAISSIEATKKYYYATLDCVHLASEKLQENNHLGYMLHEYPKLVLRSQDTKDERIQSLAQKLKVSLEKHIEIVSEASSDDGFKYTYKFRDNDYSKKYNFDNDIKESSVDFLSSFEIIDIHNDNALIMLIMRFEQFISTVFRTLMCVYPKKYIASKQIEYSKIIEIGPDKIKSFIVDREIESLMRENIISWIDKLEKHELKNITDTDTWDDFLEAYYRRNIIVHNFAVVNDCYLSALSKTNHSPSKGTLLHANEKYIEHVFVVIQIAIYSIGLSLINLEPSKSESLERYFKFGFMHLARGDWQISKFLFSAIANNKLTESITKMNSIINYWIADVQMRGLECVRPEITAYDFLAMHDRFICAKHVLLEEFGKVNSMLESLFPKEFPVAAINTWPLFIKYRTSPEFAAFKSQHTNEFDIIEHDSKDTNQSINEQNLELALLSYNSEDISSDLPPA